MYNPKSVSFSYTIGDPQLPNTLALYTIDRPSKTSDCVNFQLLDSALSPFSLPYVTFAYPDFDVGLAAWGTLSVPTVTYNLKVSAFVNLAGNSPIYADISLVVYHECYSLQLAAPKNNLYEYIIQAPTYNYPFDRFTNNFHC